MRFRMKLCKLYAPIGVPDYFKKFSLEEIGELSKRYNDIIIPTQSIDYPKVRKIIDECEGKVFKAPVYNMDTDRINFHVMDSAGINCDEFDNCQFIYGVDEIKKKYRIYVQSESGSSGYCSLTPDEFCQFYTKKTSEAIICHAEILSQIEGDIKDYFEYLTNKNLIYKNFEVRFGPLSKHDGKYFSLDSDVKKFFDSRIENSENTCIIYESEPFLLNC